MVMVDKAPTIEPSTMNVYAELKLSLRRMVTVAVFMLTRNSWSVSDTKNGEFAALMRVGDGIVVVIVGWNDKKKISRRANPGV